MQTCHDSLWDQLASIRKILQVRNIPIKAGVTEIDVKVALETAGIGLKLRSVYFDERSRETMLNRRTAFVRLEPLNPPQDPADMVCPRLALLYKRLVPLFSFCEYKPKGSWISQDRQIVFRAYCSCYRLHTCWHIDTSDVACWFEARFAGPNLLKLVQRNYTCEMQKITELIFNCTSEYFNQRLWEQDWDPLSCADKNNFVCLPWSWSEYQCYECRRQPLLQNQSWSQTRLQKTGTPLTMPSGLSQSWRPKNLP